MRNNHQNKEGRGDGAGAPIGTEIDQGVGRQDDSAAAGGDAIGEEEDEPGDDDKPPGQQLVREKKTRRPTGSWKVDYLNELCVPQGDGRSKTRTSTEGHLWVFNIGRDKEKRSDHFGGGSKRRSANF